MTQDNNNSHVPNSAVNIRKILEIITRIVILLVGIGIILFGVKHSLDIFLLLQDYLKQPETLNKIIAEWAIVLKVEGLTVGKQPTDNIVVVSFLAIGTLLLLRITLGFIHAGAKILTSPINIKNDHDEQKVITNLDSKLERLKKLAEQNKISQQAYENARDKYLIQKTMGD